MICALIKGLASSAISVLLVSEKSLTFALPSNSISVCITATISLVISHFDIGRLSLLYFIDTLAIIDSVTRITIVHSAATTTTRQGSSVGDPTKLLVSLD